MHDLKIFLHCRKCIIYAMPTQIYLTSLCGDAIMTWVRGGSFWKEVARLPYKVWVIKKWRRKWLAISKKCTIFAQSSWNLMKIITSWLNANYHKKKAPWIFAHYQKTYSFYPMLMKLGGNDHLIGWLFSSSFMRIGQKL